MNDFLRMLQSLVHKRLSAGVSRQQTNQLQNPVSIDDLAILSFDKKSVQLTDGSTAQASISGNPAQYDLAVKMCDGGYYVVNQATPCLSSDGRRTVYAVILQKFENYSITGAEIYSYWLAKLGDSPADYYKLPFTTIAGVPDDWVSQAYTSSNKAVIKFSPSGKHIFVLVDDIGHSLQDRSESASIHYGWALNWRHSQDIHGNKIIAWSSLVRKNFVLDTTKLPTPSPIPVYCDPHWSPATPAFPNIAGYIGYTISNYEDLAGDPHTDLVGYWNPSAANGQSFSNPDTPFLQPGESWNNTYSLFEYLDGVTLNVRQTWTDQRYYPPEWFWYDSGGQLRHSPGGPTITTGAQWDLGPNYYTFTSENGTFPPFKKQISTNSFITATLKRNLSTLVYDNGIPIGTNIWNISTQGYLELTGTVLPLYKWPALVTDQLVTLDDMEGTWSGPGPQPSSYDRPAAWKDNGANLQLKPTGSLAIQSLDMSVPIVPPAPQQAKEQVWTWDTLHNAPVGGKFKAGNEWDSSTYTIVDYCVK